MNILNELLMLAEAKGKNLLGLTIENKKITEQTPSEPWPGNFSCSYNQLTSLEFCPEKVGGDFYCSVDKLTSLEFCPKEVGGDFGCSRNQLTSLEFCPKEVGGNFGCSRNQLTSLEFCPKEVGGNFYCFHNQLTSLEFCPKEVGGDFYCYNNQLTSLADIHKRLKKMDGIFYAPDNPIKSNVIGLMLVAGCKEVILDNKEVQNIINKHCKSPFGHLRLLECQEDLLSAGFEEWAEL